MKRHFNTAGPLRPDFDYMLPPERLAPDPTALDHGLSLIIQGVSNSGKSTLLRELATRLRSEKRFAAVVTSCEVGQSIKPDLEGSFDAILAVLKWEASLLLQTKEGQRKIQARPSS